MTDTLDVFEWDELPELSDLTLVSYAPLQTLLRSIIHRINDHSRYLKDEKAKAKRVTEQQRDNESTTQVKPLDGSNDGGEGGGGAVDSDDGSKQQRGGEDNQMREDDSAVAEMNDQSMLLENQRTVDGEREDVVQHGVGDGGGETEKDMDTTATRQQQQDGAKSVDGSGSLPVVSSDEARTAMNDKLEEMTSALQKMDDSSRELKRQVEQLQRQLAEQQQQLTQQQQQLQDQKHQQQQQQIQPQPLLLPVAQQYDSQEQDRIPQQQQQQLLQQTQLQQQQQQQQIQQQGEDIKQLKDQNEKLNSKMDDIDSMKRTVEGLEQKLKDALSGFINDRLKDERQGWDDRFNRLTNSITAPSLLTANTNRPVTPPLSSNSKATSELQDEKSKRSEETLNSTAMLEPILKDMSKLVTRDELENMMKEVREKTDTASDRSQALDDKLMKKFKDLVTYIDSMKEQLKREMRALANSSTGTSSSPEPSDNNNGRASPNLSEHSFPLRNSITKKRSDDPLRRSRAGTLPKDGTLDAMNSPVASRREGDDMLRTISPLDKTPLDKSIMDKLTSKADQHLVQALQQKIDDMFDRLGQIDQAVDQKANKQAAATIEQVKDLEAKLRRKTDREEVTSMMERMAQESNNNNNSLHLGSPQTGDGTAGGGDKSGVAGQVLLEGEDFNRIREAINKQASTLQQLVKQKADKTEVAKQMSEKMEHIEHLDQTKADANIVARKAEREYVDNMFDRLRKELLQYVENATNSTADLFAKDLAMLQGIIEDKASRNDLRKIREVLSSSQKEDPSGEGLAGKKAYRCLSCNRSMAGMRVKPLSMNFTSFVNHLPNSKNRMYAKKSILNDSITQTRSSKEQLSPQNSGMDMSLPPVDSLMMDTSDLGANGRTSSSPGDRKTSPSGRQSREESRLPSINEHRESLK